MNWTESFFFYDVTYFDIPCLLSLRATAHVSYNYVVLKSDLLFMRSLTYTPLLYSLTCARIGTCVLYYHSSLTHRHMRTLSLQLTHAYAS